MNQWKNKRQLILAIESSCDETSVAVIEQGNKILSNIIATQIESHKRFGGVVPEVASRHHVEIITNCIELALSEADVTPDDLSAVAVTYGPGLVGALLIGLTAAKAFAWAHHLPLIPVNHMAGHIQAVKFDAEIKYPALALVVSGGHTELVYMTSATSFEIIGETRDDAVGEAYDKVGRVLGLDYPSGKIIDELALNHQGTINFPRAMLNEDNLDFSFSGLKSAVINYLHNQKQKGQTYEIGDVAASFQDAVVEVLVAKTLKAIAHYDVQTLIVAGGVAANQGLRQDLSQKMAAQYPEITILTPALRLCGDNAAMIGAAAYDLFADSQTNLALTAKPSLTLA